MRFIGSYLRKTRNLESGLSEEDVSVIESAVDVTLIEESAEVSVEEEVSLKEDALPEFPEDEPVETVVDEELVVKEGDLAYNDEKVIAALNRWLDSIQKRRADV